MKGNRAPHNLLLKDALFRLFLIAQDVKLAIFYDILNIESKSSMTKFCWTRTLNWSGTLDTQMDGCMDSKIDMESASTTYKEKPNLAN